MTFQPGKSGNPGGRTKKAAYIQGIAQEHAVQCVVVLAKLLKSKDDKVKLQAAATLLDRGYGKAQQTLSVKQEDPLSGMTIEEIHELSQSISGLLTRTPEPLTIDAEA